jgi:large subunit ribosomal protein L21
MYAVIEAGGKQYRVSPGDTVRVDTLAGNIGESIAFGKVLAVVNDANEVVLGEGLANAQVNATIESHDRGPKILVFKFKRKKQYKRTIGHRQNYTQVRVNDIVV